MKNKGRNSTDSTKWEDYYKKIQNSVDFESYRNYNKRDPYIKRMLKFAKEKKNALEFGSGKGGLSLILKRNYPNLKVNLLDLEEDAIKLSKNLFRYYGLEGNFFIGSFLDMQFEDEYFDFIHGNTVLEHVEDPEKAVKEIVRVLAPKGHVLITVPNTNRKFDHDLYHAIYRLNYFSRTFHMKELTNILEGHNCKIIERFGNGFIYHFPSYLPRYLVEKFLNKKQIPDNFEKNNFVDKHDQLENSLEPSIYSKRERMLYHATFSSLDKLWNPIQLKLNNFVNNNEILPYSWNYTIGIVAQKL